MEVSIIIIAHNAAKYIESAIHSVLSQSFHDFELIICDIDSSDKSIDIIKKNSDKRIRYFKKECDLIGALNFAVKQAQGRYIVRLDVKDIMHFDRLRIQYKIMQNNPSIDFCASWICLFGNNVSRGHVIESSFGLIKKPLLKLLNGNCFFRSTMIMKVDFIRKNHLKYKHYNYAEDYKLWVDASLSGATFYIEPQPLQYYRINNQTNDNLESGKQENCTFRIQNEIANFILKELPDQQLFEQYYHILKSISESGYLLKKNTFALIYKLFTLLEIP